MFGSGVSGLGFFGPTLACSSGSSLEEQPGKAAAVIPEHDPCPVERISVWGFGFRTGLGFRIKGIL